MDKLHIWTGTFSDEAIIESLKKEKSHMIYTRSNFENVLMTDEEIKINVLNQGMIAGGITWFFAKNLAKAKSMAKQMGLKNFSKVNDTMYEKGKDF